MGIDPELDSPQRGDQPDLPETTIHVLWCPATYVRDRFGEAKLEELAKECGFRVEQIQKRSNWVSMRQIALFLQRFRELVGDDETFAEGAVYRHKESYGASKFVMLATTPTAVLTFAAKNTHLVSKVFRYELVSREGNRVRMRYTTSKPEHETRIVCLGRRHQTAHWSCVWGLPPADVKELSCIANGDDACEYEFTCYQRAGWLPSLVGSGAAALGAAGFVEIGRASCRERV